MSDRPRLWVAGGRDYTNVLRIKSALLEYHGWVLVTGAARGADLTAETVWRDMQRPYIGEPARWALHQRSAGPRRNRTLAETWKPDRLLLFPGGSGTADARTVAEGLGIEVQETEE
jgi:hypothetical protein